MSVHGSTLQHCATCRKRVDPSNPARLSFIGQSWSFFCSPRCHTRFWQQRDHAPDLILSADSAVARDAAISDWESEATVQPTLSEPLPTAPVFPAAGLAFTLTALFLSLLPYRWWTAWLMPGWIAVSLAYLTLQQRRQGQRVGINSIIASLGVMTAALLAISADAPWLSRASGALALGIFVIRQWMQEHAEGDITWAKQHLGLSTDEASAPTAGKALQPPLWQWAYQAQQLFLIALAILWLGSMLWHLMAADHDASLRLIALTSALCLALPLTALRLSISGVWLSAMAIAYRRGITFGSTIALEWVGRVHALLFDTHGTLLRRHPYVADLQPVGADAELSSQLILNRIASLEAHSGNGPIAQAILHFAQSKEIKPKSLRNAKVIASHGIIGVDHEGNHLVFGNRQLLLSEGISIATAEEQAKAAEAEGKNVLFFACQGSVQALLMLQEHIAPAARAAVQQLYDLNIDVILLSGSSFSALSTIAKQLEIGQVKADLSLEARRQEVLKLRESGYVVASVGSHDPLRYINEAHVVFSLGTNAEAQHSRQVHILMHNTAHLANAIRYARRARRIAMRNWVLSVATGSLALAAAAGEFIAPWLVALLVGGTEVFVLTSIRSLHRATSAAS